jgi:hypothetical protein
MMFYQAWLDMRRYRLTDDINWAVKVDADTVFLPDRLLHVLKDYRVPSGGVYVENCKQATRNSFLGSMEVVSAEAFDKFLGNLAFCKSTLDWKGLGGGQPWGEDFFMKKCLDATGVRKETRLTLITSGDCEADVPRALRKLNANAPSPGAPHAWEFSRPHCARAKTAAIHPLKNPHDYFACLAATQGGSKA